MRYNYRDVGNNELDVLEASCEYCLLGKYYSFFQLIFYKDVKEWNWAASNIAG